MTEPRDELLERYAEAVAQDPRRPSDRVRNAARAHAQMLRDQAAELKRADGAPPTKTAANQPQWALSLVASLAVVGLAGLLYVQIDRGAPEDREIALGTPAPSYTPAPPKASPAPAVPYARTDMAQAVPPAPAAPPAMPPAPAAEARRQQRAVVAAAPPAEADTQPKSLGSAAEQLASAGSPSADAWRGAEAESSGAVAAPAARPAAAAPPPPPAAARRARDASVGSAAALFLEAARTGNMPALQEQLAQGMAVNTRDPNGNTALMLAVRHRQAAAVRKLLDSGADTTLLNKDGLTALHLANQMGFADMAQLLQAPR